MAIVRSVSGLRFTLDELEDNPNLIKQYVEAFNLYLPKGIIVIGRDGRPSGKDIMTQIINTLTQLGRQLDVIDIVPTPTLQLFVENHKAVGGICITASHNPADWNGLKFINGDGTFLDANQNKIFWNYLEKIDVIPINIISFEYNQAINHNAITEHINKILSIKFIHNSIYNIKKYIKKNNIKFIIDAVNAAGSTAIPMLLDRFDCDYEKLYCDNNGEFTHTPEPLPENLTAISNFIKDKNQLEKNNQLKKNYIGIVVDPDADRLVLVNENGDCVSEENTICIAIDSYYTMNPYSNGNVVVNQSTTMLADWVAKKHNKIVERSAVGEINVVKQMKKNNSAIGGEGSGGVILPECHYGRDSLVGVVLLLCLLSKKNILLNDLISSYPHYIMLKQKYNFSGNKENLYNKIKNANANYKMSEIDGIKIYYDNSWIHIRTSNTEEVVRIISEAKDIISAKTNIKNILICCEVL